jgi:hypothetical protein
MMNPLASRLALLLAVEGVEQEVRLSLAAKALPLVSLSRKARSAEEVAEEVPLFLAEEGVDREMCLSLAAKAKHSDCRIS